MLSPDLKLREEVKVLSEGERIKKLEEQVERLQGEVLKLNLQNIKLIVDSTLYSRVLERIGEAWVDSRLPETILEYVSISDTVKYLFREREDVEGFRFYRNQAGDCFLVLEESEEFGYEGEIVKLFNESELLKTKP